jgi:hypothetical protein
MNPAEPNSRLGILKKRNLLMGDPRLKPLWAEYRQILQSIWDHRGYYGALDLLHAYEHRTASFAPVTDWDSLFAALDIDPEAGRSQLRDAVKRFTTTPAYAALVEATGTRDKRFGAKLTWLDDTLGPYLAGHFNETLKADPKLLALANRVFAHAYYDSQPVALLRDYGRALAVSLTPYAGKSMTIEELRAVDLAVLEGIALGLERGAGNTPAYELPAWDFGWMLAEAIEHSALLPNAKKNLLKAAFLDGYDAGLNYDYVGHWFRTDRAKTIARLLIKNGAAADFIDIFSRAREPRPMSAVSFWGINAFKAELLV